MLPCRKSRILLISYVLLRGINTTDNPADNLHLVRLKIKYAKSLQMYVALKWVKTLVHFIHCALSQKLVKMFLYSVGDSTYLTWKIY
jgi:hypothetical protein